MGREFEIKYRLTQEALEDLFQRFGPFETVSMETTYYDALDHSLSARKWTLRRRLENGVSVCTLKTPCPNGGRGEWEVEAPDIEAALETLVSIGAPKELLTLAKGLNPVCSARFTRQKADFLWGSSRLELALDRGKLLGGSKEAPIFEVEAEVKSGQDTDALAFGTWLEENYGLVPEPKSKYKRARELAQEGR